MEQIQEVDRAMIRLQAQFGVPAQNASSKSNVTVSGKPGTVQRAGRSRRGALKAKIVKALRASGQKGASVSELSQKLKVRAANLYVWFNGTGRNVPGLKKVGPARYRLG